MTELSVTPVNVHIVGSDLVTAEKRPKEKRVSSKTIVLTAANPYQMAVGVDPTRCEVHIQAITNAVVLSHNLSQASDASNLVTPLVNPNGRALNPLIGEYIVPGGANEIWFSAGIYPTLVGITVVRDI